MGEEVSDQWVNLFDRKVTLYVLLASLFHYLTSVVHLAYLDTVFVKY